MINIPNSITLLRILLIPIFVLAFYLPGHHSNLIASGIFAIAAITDWLDGFLARRLGQISKFGQFLDPVADKLMVAVVLVFLIERYPSIWLAMPAAVIICREITISALREWMAELGSRTKINVSLLGKIKTFAQMLALVLLLYREPVGQVSTFDLGFILLYISAILTLWSMCIYLKTAWPELRDSR